MLKLIRLELTKNKLTTYLMAVLCIFVTCLGFSFLFGFIPLIESVDGVIPKDMEKFQRWGGFISLVSILYAMSFGILSAVMHTKFTVEEYTGKSAVLLFSYPQSRSKILFAKCSLVFCFTAVSMFVCNVISVLIFSFFSNIFTILSEQFNSSFFLTLLSISGVCSLLAASIGLIAMRVGFWKKSLIATVVTAVILIVPFSNALSYLPEYSGTIHLVGMVVLLVIGLFIVMGLMRKVNKMECV